MKTITSIYRTFTFVYVLLAAVIFYGCGKGTIQQPLTHIDKIYPIIDKIDACDGIGFRNIRVYEIDSCEYIGHINAFNSDFLTHKGNCKFCTERSKK